MIYNKKIKLPVLCYGLFVFSCQNKDRSVSASDTKGSEKEESLIVEYQDPTDKELKKVKNEKKKLENKIKENETKITSLEEELKEKTKEIKEKENLIRNSNYKNSSKLTEFQEEKQKLEKEIKGLKAEETRLNSELTKLETEKTTLKGEKTTLENTVQDHLKSFCKLIYETLKICVSDFVPAPVPPVAPALNALNVIITIRELQAQDLESILKSLGIKVNFGGGGIIADDIVLGGQNQITGFTFSPELSEISVLFDVTKNSTEIKDAINAKFGVAIIA